MQRPRRARRACSKEMRRNLQRTTCQPPIFQCQYSHFRIPFKKLVDEPLAIPLESKLPPVNPLRPIHTLDYLEKPTYCAWGLKNRGDCV
jgi:hypothetical protein